MSARVTTGLADDGRPVARKRSRDSADASRLRHEAAVLDAARHPGIVELVSCGPADDVDFELATAFVGAHSLDTMGPLPYEQAAGAVAALAETVADLHDIGICHGRIEPSHVLLGPGGRPVLCGFGGAGQPGSIEPASDVFGLGTLLRTLVVDAATADIEPIPERRWAFARVRRWTGYDRRGLLTLADHATDDDPLRRPSARRLAASIRDAVPSARLVDTAPVPSDGESIADDPRQPLRRRATTLVAAIVGLALLVYGVTNLGSGSRPSLPEAEAAASVCGPPAGPVADDLDGDGCPDPVRVAGEGVVAVGATRFAIGAPGDRIVVGDWDCDGVATPAVLRPATGEVFVFSSWASPGADVEIKAVARVEGAVDIATGSKNGCAVPKAVLADGRLVEVLS